MSIAVDGIECDEHESALYVVAFERALPEGSALRSAVNVCTVGTAGPGSRRLVEATAADALDRAAFVVRAWRVARRMRGEA